MILTSAHHAMRERSQRKQEVELLRERILCDSEILLPVSRACVRNLSVNESVIIILRFGLFDGKRRTLVEIAESLNLCKQRVHQIETNALRKLCIALKNEL